MVVIMSFTKEALRALMPSKEEIIIDHFKDKLLELRDSASRGETSAKISISSLFTLRMKCSFEEIMIYLKKECAGCKVTNRFDCSLHNDCEFTIDWS